MTTTTQAIAMAREALNAASSSLACAMVDAPQLEVWPTYQRVCAAIAAADAALARPAEPRPLPDHDNHHNALKCPYCNPRRLVLVDPSEVAQPAEPLFLDASDASISKARAWLADAITEAMADDVQAGMYRDQTLADGLGAASKLLANLAERRLRSGAAQPAEASAEPVALPADIALPGAEIAKLRSMPKSGETLAASLARDMRAVADAATARAVAVLKREPMTDVQITLMLGELHSLAAGYEVYEYGLPLHDEPTMAAMRASVRRAVEAHHKIGPDAAGSGGEGC